MPSEATVQNQIARLADILIFLLAQGGSATPNLLDKEAALVPAGDFNDALTAGLKDIQGGMENAVGACGRSFDAMLRSYGQIMQVPDTDGTALSLRLYRWAIDTGITVKSREFTYGTPSGPSANQGNGHIRRLTKDAYGYDIESCYPELKQMLCTNDRFSGADSLGGEEKFKIWGDARSASRLRVLGSGLSGTIRGRTGRDTQGLVNNPSFSAVTGTAPAVDTFVGWTKISGTMPTCDQDNYFRTYQGEGTPASMSFSDDALMRQDMSLKQAKFIPDRPYFWNVKWNTEIGNAVAGTAAKVIMRVGAVTVEAPFDGTEVGWKTLLCPMDENCWFRNIDTDPLYIEVEVQGLSGGTLKLDDIILVQFDRFDSTYLTVDGGDVPFMFDDEYSYEDEAEDDCEVQRLFAYQKGLYLPHGTGATGSPISWADV